MEPDIYEIFANYSAWKYDEYTWIINFMQGTQNMYLVEGEENALLIDTGWGSGTLRPFVENLTDKSILVINTHGHLDHSGSNGEWDSVMMLKGAVSDLLTLDRSPFDVSKLPYPNYEKEFVTNEDIIDLGNHSLEVIEISSHSNGSLALLDKVTGNLFVGDELESAQVLMYETDPRPERPEFILDLRLKAHHANMMGLKARKGEWNKIFPAHNGSPIADSYLDDTIGLVEHIYDGDATIEDKLNHEYAEAGDPEHRLCRVRWNKVSFFVVKEDLMKIWKTGWKKNSI